MTKAPMIVSPIVPRPPNMEAPPSTAEAMAFSSNVVPVAGWAAGSSEEMMRPTIAAQKPEIMSTNSLTRLTRMPDSAAARSLPPPRRCAAPSASSAQNRPPLGRQRCSQIETGR